MDDGVDADDSSTEGDDGVSPKEVIDHVVPTIRFLDPNLTKATVVMNFPLEGMYFTKPILNWSEIFNSQYVKWVVTFKTLGQIAML